MKKKISMPIRPITLDKEPEKYITYTYPHKEIKINQYEKRTLAEVLREIGDTDLTKVEISVQHEGYCDDNMCYCDYWCKLTWDVRETKRVNPNYKFQKRTYDKELKEYNKAVKKYNKQLEKINNK